MAAGAISITEKQLLALLLQRNDSSTAGQVLDLLPRVSNFSYANNSERRNCLHLLARWDPGESQLTIAREICRRLLLGRRDTEAAKTGCLYGKTLKGGNDPIRYAARVARWLVDQTKFVEFVQLLLDTDMQLMKKYDDRGNFGNKAQIRLMESAVAGGCKALIKYLAVRFGWKDAGEGLAGIRTPGGCSLPQVATIKGNVDLLKWFSKQSTWHSIPLNLEDNDGETALFDAAANGQSEALKYLLDHGECDIDHRGRLGDTALFRALKNDQFDAAGELLERGASAAVRDFGGNCAMHAALQKPERLSRKQRGLPPEEAKRQMSEMLQLLQKSYKVSMRTENLAGYNPLHSCVETKNWAGLRAAMDLLGLGARGEDARDEDAALANSADVNLLHVFFSFHSSQEDIKELQKILGLRRWARLLRVRTVKGKGHGGRDRVGYNCLHFACEFNNSSNINGSWGAMLYLLDSASFCMSDRTATGKSAADLLLKHRSFSDVRDIYELSSGQDRPGSMLTDQKHLHLCSLIDPVRAASSPGSSAEASHQRLARKLLSLCRGEQERSELLRFPTTSLSSFNSGRRGLASGGRPTASASMETPLGVRLLVRCIKEDNADGVRSLAALGLLDGMWNQAEFGGDFSRQLRLPKDNQNKQPPVDVVEYCISNNNDKYKVGLELLRCRQFDLVPACLRFIVYCNRRIDESRDVGQRESLRRHRDQAKNVLLNALNCLDDRVGEEDARLVQDYLEGAIQGGPRYKEFATNTSRSQEGVTDDNGAEFSITELLEMSSVEEAFATSCVRRLVSSAWPGDRRTGEKISKGSACCCAPSGCCSPETKFILHILTYIIFTVCFTVFITMGEACYSLNAPGGQTLYTILALFALDFVVMHACELWSARRPHKKKTCRLACWQIVRWLAELLGPLLLLAGLIGLPVVEFVPQLKASAPALFGVHMCLASAYLLMSARWLKFFKWHRFSGPTVGTIEKLLVQDLLPFLLIFLVFVVAFGVFFQVLLHPWRQAFAFVGRAAQNLTVADVIIDIYSRPLMLTFGEIEIESLRKCQAGLNCSDLKDLDCTCPYYDGTRAYLAVFGFVFLILNLALLNLLIAKFNLTVNNSERKELVTWNSYRFKLLKKFQQLPPAPPPYSWISGLIHCYRANSKQRQDRAVSATDEKRTCWWHDAKSDKPWKDLPKDLSKKDLPDDYKTFLWFQAQKFRDKRADFLQPVQFPTIEEDDVDEDAERQLRECRRLCHRNPKIGDEGANN